MKLGMLTNMNISEQQQAELMKEAGKRGSFPVNMVYDITYYDNLNSMQMGLESKSIDEMSTYQCVSDYLLARNDKFAQTDFKQVKLEDGFCCAVREEDKELLEEMNKAISAMKDDGTLDKLVQEYIKDVKAGEEPHAVELEKAEGRRILKVAVTGGKTVDVIFWAVIPEDKFNVRPKDFDLPKGAATTVPYYKDEIVHLALKK